MLRNQMLKNSLFKLTSPIIKRNLSTNHFRPVVYKRDTVFEKTHELPEAFVADLYKTIHCNQPRYKVFPFINNSPYVENIPLQKLKVNYLRMYLPDLIKEKKRTFYFIQSDEQKLSSGEILDSKPMGEKELFLLRQGKWDEFIEQTFHSYQYDLSSLHKRAVAIEKSLKIHLEDEAKTLEFICHQEKNIYVPIIPLVTEETNQKILGNIIYQNRKKLGTPLTLGEMVLTEFSQSFPQTSPFFSYGFQSFSFAEHIKAKK